MKDAPRQGTLPITAVLTTSAVVAYVAIGAAAILGRSLRDAAREALTWLLSRDGTRGHQGRRQSRVRSADRATALPRVTLQ